MKDYNHNGKSLEECMGMETDEVQKVFMSTLKVIFNDKTDFRSVALEKLEKLMDDPAVRRVVGINFIFGVTSTIDSLTEEQNKNIEVVK